MGHPAAKYFYPPAHVYRKRSSWRVPADRRLEVSPRPTPEGSSWKPAIGAEPQCEIQSTEISEGYKAAMALLRSLRHVSDEEAQEQRETWKLLEQALDEDKYH
jgi:hypothetical protein